MAKKYFIKNQRESFVRDYTKLANSKTLASAMTLKKGMPIFLNFRARHHQPHLPPIPFWPRAQKRDDAKLI